MLSQRQILGEMNYPENSKQPHEQATDRLQYLRLFFPFYEKYCSQGLYVYPLPVEALDDTVKKVPREMLYLKSDQSRNNSWLRLCEQPYKVDSFYQWQEQWNRLRCDWLSCMKRIIKIYTTMYRGGKVKQRDIDTQFGFAKEAMHNSQHVRKLSEEQLAQDISLPMQDIDALSVSVINFLSQFWQHDLEDAKQRFSHLMRHNLREAIKLLPNAHSAFKEILGNSQDYFDMARLDAEEMASYQHLTDILDYWFEVPHQQVRNLRDAVERHKGIAKRRFQLAVKSAIKPLEKTGIKLYYPNEPLIDHPLAYLCIGFNVYDFRELQKNYIEIVLHISQIDEKYDFLFIAPLIKGQRYSPVVLRISDENVRKIAASEISEGDSVLLPVDPPIGMFDVLPDVEQTSLLELDVLEDFASIHNDLGFASRRKLLAESRLDEPKPFEDELLCVYKQKYDEEIQNLQLRKEQLNRKMSEITEHNLALEKWKMLCSFMSRESNELRYDSLELMTNPEFNHILSLYMNERYLT